MTTAIDYSALAMHAAGRRSFGRAVARALADLEMTEMDLARELLGKTEDDYRDKRMFWAALDSKAFAVSEVVRGMTSSAGLMRRIGEVVGLEADEVAA